MRGKVLVFGLQIHVTRITPAYAGKSFTSSTSCSGVTGSPPPMRGKVQLRIMWNTRRRITPAYAGKRTCFEAGKHDSEDHPRLCGEKEINSHNSFLLLGSPPPMRGKGIKRL